MKKIMKIQMMEDAKEYLFLSKEEKYIRRTIDLKHEEINSLHGQIFAQEELVKRIKEKKKRITAKYFGIFKL